MRYILFLLLLVFTSIQLTCQNLKINGYKGIWYTIEQSSEYGYKYSGGLGTYTANHTPTAIYAPEVNRTFFVYGGTTRHDERNLVIMISYFDHNSGLVPKPVIVLDKKGVNDPHDNASISMDKEGYIWVFISGRNVTRPGYVYKSAEPYSIHSFEQVQEKIMTYPQPWWIKDKGFIHLFTKYTAPGTRGRELYWSTSNDGISWTPDRKLAGMGGHYQLSSVHKNRVVTVFNYHPEGNADKRTNIYLLQTDDMGKNWKTIDGKKMKTPLTNPQSKALVHDFESENKLVYLNDLSFDKNGNPVILAVISRHFQPGPKGNPREWVILKWDNKKWVSTSICVSTHNYDMGSLYIDTDEWAIIGPTEAGPQHYGTGGEIAKWVSKDEGKTWSKVQAITEHSKRNHSYARRPLNAHDDFYSFWADGNADSFSISKLYFTNKKGDKVWQLPYNMEDEFAKPLQVTVDMDAKKGTQPFGVNLASAEFNEANMPGVYNKHYTYPTTKELDYFKSKGLQLVRLPFKWERMQPELSGMLDPEELKRLKQFVREAREREMHVILDLHNYARRFVDGEKLVIGTPKLTVAHYADFWKKLALEMKEFNNIYGHGLMNEPHDMPSSTAWFEMAQAAIHAIREVDMDKTIIVGGDDWSSAERWMSKSENLKYLVDPADNLMFEAHVYFDNDASGSYKKSYDEEKCSPAKGVERVAPFVKWLKENNFRGFIGEYGVPANDERWLITMDNFLDYLQQNGINATYWAAGPWWGNYKLSIEPKDGEDKPQMGIVKKYLQTHPITNAR